MQKQDLKPKQKEHGRKLKNMQQSAIYELYLYSSLITFCSKRCWPKQSEEIFQFSSQAPCLPRTVETSHCLFLLMNPEAVNTNFSSLRFTRPIIIESMK